jgi:amino acid permease
LTNAFGAVDLAVGCGCLLLALHWKEIPRKALIICVIGIVSYLLVSPFLTPTLIRTISEKSQFVGGDFTPAKMLPWRIVTVAGLLGLSFATRRMRDYFMRFTVLFAFVFLAIVSLALIANRAALPQPSRYSPEMEMGVALAAAFLFRPLMLPAPPEHANRLCR